MCHVYEDVHNEASLSPISMDALDVDNDNSSLKTIVCRKELLGVLDKTKHMIQQVINFVEEYSEEETKDKMDIV